MNTVDKLNNTLGYLTAMSFDKPELSNDLVEPLNALSEAISEVENLSLSGVVRSKTLESKIANKRQRIKGDLQNAKNIINGNKGMSSDYIIDKTRNMPFLRCKLNLIDELLEN